MKKCVVAILLCLLMQGVRGMSLQQRRAIILQYVSSDSPIRKIVTHFHDNEHVKFLLMFFEHEIFAVDEGDRPLSLLDQQGNPTFEWSRWLFLSGKYGKYFGLLSDGEVSWSMLAIETFHKISATCKVGLTFHDFNHLVHALVKTRNNRFDLQKMLGITTQLHCSTNVVSDDDNDLDSLAGNASSGEQSDYAEIFSESDGYSDVDEE